VKRLLIVRNDRVGDLILTLPAFEYARKAFPDAEITVLAAKHTAVLLDGNPNVDRVLRDDGRLPSKELASRLKPHRFDAAIVVKTNPRNCLAVWRAGIPIRVAWASEPLGALLGNRRVMVRRSHPPIHESQFALAFVKRLKMDASIELSVPSIGVNENVLHRIRSRIQADLGAGRPWFGVHPGSFNSTYNWPIARYRDLVEKLADHGSVVVTVGPGEQEMLTKIRTSLPSRVLECVAFYHEFDLMELAAAIALEDVLTVSNTGPMHLAGVLGTPLVALFSAHPLHSRAKWEPFGQQKTILQAPVLDGENPEIPEAKADDHMARITVDEVVEANLRHLLPTRGRQSG
jgi:ADP-heptose:LPS heptosyltransferase